MFVTILSSKKYWMSVSFIGIGFIFIYSIIEYFMQYSTLGWEAFITERIANQNWVRYIISRIVGGVLYGMIMAYYFELRKLKSKR